PAAVFYLVLRLGGVRGALVGALAWCYGAVGLRLLARRPLPALLVIGALLLSVRTAIGLATDSGFVYFLQPSVGTFLVALAFFASVLAKRPLAERLARDFCPLDPALLATSFVRRFFLRVTLLWTLIMAANSALSLWLLLSSSLGDFVVLRTALSAGLTGAGVAASTWWFTRTLKAQAIEVRWQRRPRPQRPSA
ncbi:MAG TPA: VC0807 family protein, partial [Acidimicrobiales bacterium]|nr:VC0807 family protein [Acidimicrobiales bacterium]